MIRRKHFKTQFRPRDRLVRVSTEIGKIHHLVGNEDVESTSARMIEEGLDFIYGEITSRLERMRMHVHFASGMGANAGRIDSLFDELIEFIRDTDGGGNAALPAEEPRVHNA
jgi:hypothetical protein